MKWRTLLAFLGLLLPATTKPVPLVATTVAALGISASYFWHSWHARAKDLVHYQESIRSYHLTVCIKRHVKTVKQQSFSGTDYKKVIAQALSYAQKEQITGLRALYKPEIKTIDNWDMLPLGHIVKKVLPKNQAKAPAYWKQVEERLNKTFFVSHPQPKPLEYYKLALLGLVGLFLAGLAGLYFATPKKCRLS